MRFGGVTQTLTGYEHLGEGILPTHYWVDEQGRMIVSFAGLRAFILVKSSMARENG